MLAITIGFIAVGVMCRNMPIPQPPLARSCSAALRNVCAVSMKPCEKKAIIILPNGREQFMLAVKREIQNMDVNLKKKKHFYFK